MFPSSLHLYTAFGCLPSLHYTRFRPLARASHSTRGAWMQHRPCSRMPATPRTLMQGMALLKRADLQGAFNKFDDALARVPLKVSE